MLNRPFQGHRRAVRGPVRALIKCKVCLKHISGILGGIGLLHKHMAPPSIREELWRMASTCGPTGGERKLEGRKVIGVTSPRELSSPLVFLISACIIIFHLIVSYLTSSHLISSYLIISHLVVPSALSSYSATTFSQLISFIISHPILSYIILS